MCRKDEKRRHDKGKGIGKKIIEKSDYEIEQELI